MGRQAGRTTPLDALALGARERFLLSLVWGSRGLGSFDPDVLADELPQPRIDAILQLFGDEVARHAPRSRLPAGTAESRPAATDRIGPLERRYTDFYRVTREQHGPDAPSLVAQSFDALLADAYDPRQLQDLDERHLAMLWNAARTVAGLAPSPRHVEAMEAVFDESVRRSRGQPPAERVRAMRNALLASHRFDAARQLGVRYPTAALSPLPAFIEPTGDHSSMRHGIWRMSGDGSRLQYESLDLRGTRIVVTAGCHFSLDAVADISADPVLGPAFAGHAYWLMQPPGVEDIDAVREWNRRFSRAPALMIHDREGWPMLADWPMPEFHVLQDGRIVDSLTGWPRGDDGRQREALMGMLRRAGLIGHVRPRRAP
ncbi:hypothetical protein FZO89_01215 [Luteimonas viscosa]|uniref:Uncharacterized protein n=1 Tax=Luteimonas viscosa TaxID=1132694 RepID=A0A5D4XJZ3_9GAMM|nr:hypothetical protein [Luteimonas viscosa]TYT25008.1 hypothetical protein FZO89_01215 [Luteimonas viscosa]